MSQTIEILLRAATPSATEWLLLETGQPARVLSAEGERVIGDETLTRQAIISSVASIVPPDVRRRLPSELLVDFEYDAGPVGRYTVSIERTPNDPQQLAVTATPLEVPTGASPPDPSESVAPVAPEPPASMPEPVIESPSPTGVDTLTGTDLHVIEDTSEPAVIEHTAEPARSVTEYTSDQTAVIGQTPTPAPGIEHAFEPAQPTTTSPDEGSPTIEHTSQAVAPPPLEPPPPTPAAVAAPAADGPAPMRTPGQPAAIDELFHGMFNAGASDLHLSVGMPPIVRKDGDLQLLDDTRSPFEPAGLRQLLLEITPPKNRSEFDERHDTDFAYEIPGLARFRANIFLDRKGIGAVFRVIPADILTAEQLRLSPQILNLGRLTKGLVLVTGPTGSGKSTTLTALIDHINKTRDDHIITIEDPIEFVHENHRCLVNQREVHTHTAGFKSALRAALREDPDILLVGEMRDLETISIAVETAETGHLVFGTLHTSTASSTVDRMIDQFPPDQQAQIRVMLSESLRGVISQTLCRKIGGGRVAALEVLIANSAISNLIREGKTFQIPSMMQVGRASGMVVLNEALGELVKERLIEPEEAYSKALDKAGMETLLKRLRVDTSFITPEKSGA